VPDFYQGTELWDLHLVDPDNRQPVDYETRIKYLEDLRVLLEDSDVGRGFPSTWPAASLRAGSPADRPATHHPTPALPDGGSLTRPAFVRDLLANWHDGRIKMLVTTIGLRLRLALPDLFLRGEYLPLDADLTGLPADIVAFARRLDGETLIVAVPRLISKLVNLEMPVGDVWGEARLFLPPSPAGHYRNMVTGEVVEAVTEADVPALRLRDAFRDCPVACLLAE
jgi:(1->4)-alpha-D-glucan 1-alpha-D-glucosylmutase